jgi:hypothetical protein
MIRGGGRWREGARAESGRGGGRTPGQPHEGGRSPRCRLLEPDAPRRAPPGVTGARTPRVLREGHVERAADRRDAGVALQAPLLVRLPADVDDVGEQREVVTGRARGRAGVDAAAGAVERGRGGVAQVVVAAPGARLAGDPDVHAQPVLAERPHVGVGRRDAGPERRRPRHGLGAAEEVGHAVRAPDPPLLPVGLLGPAAIRASRQRHGVRQDALERPHGSLPPPLASEVRARGLSTIIAGGPLGARLLAKGHGVARGRAGVAGPRDRGRRVHTRTVRRGSPGQEGGPPEALTRRAGDPLEPVAGRPGRPDGGLRTPRGRPATAWARRSRRRAGSRTRRAGAAAAPPRAPPPAPAGAGGSAGLRRIPGG